jgi:hypothetical protein
MGETSRASRRERLLATTRALARTIQDDDEAALRPLQRAAESHRFLAPLAFTVGAFAMLLGGVKVLLTNWRLLLVQVLPAVWIWLAMFDLKLHVLHGRSFKDVRGAILIPIAIAIVALTAASFFLNAVFAFAIAGERPPKVRPGFTAARAHLRSIAVSGVLVGVPLAIATLVSPRWGPPWFTLTLGVVIGAMMVIYVAVPARMIGARPATSKRDKLTASVLATVLGATVSTPPYLLGRIGLLMLGSRALLIPGIVVFTIGFTLQAGATGAVRAVKLSSRLLAGEAEGSPSTQDGGAAGPA